MMEPKVTCPKCGEVIDIDAEDLLSMSGTMLVGRRTVNHGAAKKIRRCKYCDEKFGAREMRVHHGRGSSYPGVTAPLCPKKPPPAKPGRPKKRRP